MEGYGTARQATYENIILCMRIACWIAKTTNTHSERVLLIAFPPRQWLHVRASLSCNTCITGLVDSARKFIALKMEAQTQCGRSEEEVNLLTPAEI
jgi:hypothetical protein